MDLNNLNDLNKYYKVKIGIESSMQLILLYIK